MPTHPHPQGPLAVERIEPAFDELPDELQVESSYDSGWITVSYRGETIARYLPVREIAELSVHFVVDEIKVGADEPDDVTDSIVRALSLLQDHGFEICHEDAEPPVSGRHHQILILRNSPVTEEEVRELVPMVLEASRYAIDITADQDTVEKSSD